jgi:hypothetical protein
MYTQHIKIIRVIQEFYRITSRFHTQHGTIIRVISLFACICHLNHPHYCLILQFVSLFHDIKLVEGLDQVMSAAEKMKVMRENRRQAQIEAAVLIQVHESADEEEKETMEEDVKKARKVVSDEQERKAKRSVSDKRSNNKRKHQQCLSINCFVFPPETLDASSLNSIYRELMRQVPLTEAAKRRNLLQPFGINTNSFFVAGTICPVAAYVEEGRSKTAKQSSHDALTTYLTDILDPLISLMQLKNRNHVFVDYAVIASGVNSVSQTVVPSAFDVPGDANLSHSEMPFSCIFPVNASLQMRLFGDKDRDELPLKTVDVQWCLKLAAFVSHACGPNAHLCEQYRIQLKFSTKKEFLHPRGGIVYHY